MNKITTQLLLISAASFLLAIVLLMSSVFSPAEAADQFRLADETEKSRYQMHNQTIMVDGLRIFYRKAIISLDKLKNHDINVIATGFTNTRFITPTYIF